MSKKQFLMVLGVWVMVFLFLGVPILWHKIIALISGLLITAIAYSMKSNSENNPESTPPNPEENL